jgi:hypothetical protein
VTSGLQVPDDGLDGGAAAQFAVNDPEDAALLTGEEDATRMTLCTSARNSPTREPAVVFCAGIASQRADQIQLPKLGLRSLGGAIPLGSADRLVAVSSGDRPPIQRLSVAETRIFRSYVDVKSFGLDGSHKLFEAKTDGA